MPVISGLSFAVTDSTIVATWTTDVSADSNLFAGAKAAIDNGYAANSTAHQCIVVGLTPNTVYSCHVVSGGVSSASSNVRTNPAQNRIPILGAAMGTPTTFGNTSGGDSLYTFQSSDGVTYLTMNDGFGATGVANPGANIQLCKFTNNATLAGADVNRVTSYTPGGSGTNKTSGTDGPGGTPMRAANWGPFSLAGHLFMFLARNNQGGPPAADNFGNVIMDNGDHGATWNKFTAPGTFNANGVGPCDGVTNPDIAQYARTTYGYNAPVLFAADDGTLGYNTAGNQIDGANAFVYIRIRDNDATNNFVRWPRIAFLAQDNSKIQYWIGPTTPTPADFVNDANWSSSDTSRTELPINVQAYFVPALNRYVGLGFTQASVSNTTFQFYEGPTPIGPWTLIYTQNNNPSGWVTPAILHPDLIANTATDQVALRVLFAGNFNNSFYQPRASKMVLFTTNLLPNRNSFVQGAGNLVFPGNVTAGNLLIVANRNTAAMTTVTDNLGDSVPWTIVAGLSDGGGTFGGWAYKFAGASGPCTVTVGPTGGVSAVGEWHGPTTARVPPAMHLVAGSLTASNPITATVGDLLVGIGEQSSGGAAPLVTDSGFTLRNTFTSAGTTFLAIEDNPNAAGGSTTAGWSGWGGAASGTYGIGAFFASTPSQFTISGNVGVAGATISYTGAASGSVIADASGNFTIPNLFPGSYTLTPSLAGETFSPATSSRTITNANITGVNFTATATGGGDGKFDFSFRF